MSLFDPQHVYQPSTRITRKGQIIQKKPIERNPPLGVKDKDKAIHILKSFGLKAIPINAPPEPVPTIYKDGLWLPLTINFNYQDPEMNIRLTYNDIWTQIGNRLDPILAYEDKVVDCILEYYIDSIEYIFQANRNTVVNLQTNKINWYNNIDQPTGLLAVPLTTNDFQYVLYRPGSWGNIFNQAFAHPDSVTALGYESTRDVSIYQELCQNHQVSNDFNVVTIYASNEGITSFKLNIIMSVKVEYLDDAEPV